MKSLMIKTPEQGVVRGGVGIIALNQVGSRASQDAGRDAQALANKFQVLTIAANRPASLWHPRKVAGALATDAVKATMELGRKLAAITELRHLQRIILVGRSAGGLGALELAQTEALSGLAFLYAAEPVGCVDYSVVAGAERYRNYHAEERVLFRADDAQPSRQLVHPKRDYLDLPLHTRLSRGVTMVPFFLMDKALNQNHWNQELVPGYLGRIAAMGVRSHIDFAEHSMVLPTDEQARHAVMQTMFATAGDSNSVLHISVLAGKTHSSFDNRNFFADRLQQTAAQGAGIVLPPPEF